VSLYSVTSLTIFSREEKDTVLTCWGSNAKPWRLYTLTCMFGGFMAVFAMVRVRVRVRVCYRGLLLVVFGGEVN